MEYSRGKGIDRICVKDLIFWEIMNNYGGFLSWFVFLIDIL